VTLAEAASVSIDKFVEQWRKANNKPGVAVGITDKNRTTSVSTYGYSNIDAKIPPTRNTLFWIGSTGKSFACLLLLQLRDEGLVDLRKPIKFYLPWLEIRSRFRPITLHHLMTHTAGIPGGNLPAGAQRSEVRNLGCIEASAHPGDLFYYSNVGYSMLGLVVEKVLGTSYEDALRSRILRPVGMASATTSISSSIRERMATGYAPLHDDRPIGRRCRLAPAPWVDFDSSAGPISSTAGDMAKYLRMIANRGECEKGRIVSENGFNLMIKKHTRVDRKWPWPLGWYGYGLNVGEKDGHLMVGHSGLALGFTTHMLVDMTSSFGVIVLTNRSSLGRPWEPAEFIIRTLNAQSKGEALPPVPRPQDPLEVKNPEEYAGVYKGQDKRLRVRSKGKHLLLEDSKLSIVLEPRAKDTFLAEKSDYDLCLMTFGREKGKVVDLCHGSDWYTNDKHEGQVEFDCPKEWETYTGHYRSFNPWLSNFRVALRKGKLILIVPMEDTEEPLVPMRDGSFRVGRDKRLPERVRFDGILDGKATRMWYSGEALNRTFTP